MSGLRTREAVCLTQGGRAPAEDQGSCDSGPEPERSQACRVEKCEGRREEADMEEELEYEEDMMEDVEPEDVEPEELELMSSTRASPVLDRDNNIISNEIPTIVPEEKYRAAASRSEEVVCEDKFKNCNIVVQAHLCVYSFYQSNCCRSCRDITTKS